MQPMLVYIRGREELSNIIKDRIRAVENKKGLVMSFELTASVLIGIRYIPSCHVSVDSIDFRIPEHTTSSSRWFLHKNFGPGVRYGIGILVINLKIVWTNEPISCGIWPDLRIF